MTQGAATNPQRLVTRMVTGVIAACVLGFTLAFTAPVASATPADDAFISALKTLNIPTASDDAAIQIGQNVCTAVEAGKIEPARTLRGIISALMGQGLSKNQAANLVWAASDSYCPQYRAILGR